MAGNDVIIAGIVAGTAVGTVDGTVETIDVGIADTIAGGTARTIAAGMTGPTTVGITIEQASISTCDFSMRNDVEPRLKRPGFLIRACFPQTKM